MSEVDGDSTAAQAADDGVRVLEIRIHGVGNTPPQGTLGVDVDKVVRTRGDDLASFWETKEQQAAEQPAAGDTPSAVRARHVEAYSWGSLARASALPGLGFVAGLGQAAIRAAWTFVIPLGIANAAYWARRIPEDRFSTPGRDGVAPGTTTAPFGAAAVRLFCLTLTLLLVATFAIASVDIVGTQCFGALEDKTPAADPREVSRLVCAQLPSAVRSMAGMSDGQRIAVLALVPVALLVLLVLLAASGRTRFDARVSVTRAVKGGTTTDAPWKGTPVLARTGFWRTAARSSKDSTMHVASGLALVAGYLAYQRWTGIASPGLLGSDGLWVALFCVAALLIFGVAFRVVSVTTGFPDIVAEDPPVIPRRLGRVLLRVFSHRILWLGALGLLGVELVLLALSGDYLPGAREGEVQAVSYASDALATALVSLLVLLCIVGVGLRRGARGPMWMGLVLAIVLFGLAAAVLGVRSQSDPAWIAAVVVVVLLVALVAHVVNGDKGTETATLDGAEPTTARSRNKYEGWAGTAPAVFMTLAAGLAVLMSSLVVVGVAALLEAPEAPQPAGSGAEPGVIAIPATPRSPESSVVGTHHVLAAPTVFTAFGWATIAVLVGLVALAGLIAWRGLRAPEIPVRPRASYLGLGRLSPAGAEVVMDARRAAAMAQRAEIAVGGFAVLLAGALAFALGAAVLAAIRAPSADSLGCRAVCSSTSLRVAVAALIAGVAAAVLSNALAGTRSGSARPWGFLWDLQCFLPRAAHPFGPPCYSERVVPELRRRIDDWLEDEDQDPTGESRRQDRSRRVVVSGHSMGVVLAVAALFARWDGATHNLAGETVSLWADPRISLLTYGTQLRPYFGRFFPELLGPDVIGNRPCLRPRLRSTDPWSADPDVPAVPQTDGTQVTTLLDSLGGRAEPRWISLWRRTDFAGFPVDQYTIGPPLEADEPQPPEWPEPPADGGPDPAEVGRPRPPHPLDRMATEYDEQAYMFVAARHSGYPQTAAYERAMADLVARMNHQTDGL